MIRSLRIVIVGLIALLLLCMLVFNGLALVGLNSLERANKQAFTDLATEYANHCRDLIDRIESLESENADLRARLGLHPSTPGLSPQQPTDISPESATFAKTLLLVETPLVVCLGCIGAVLVIVYSSRIKKKHEAEIEHVRTEAYRRGYMDAPEQLVTGTDLLSNLLRWLWWYGKGKARIEDAATIQMELLKRLITSFHLVPIGEIDKVVHFDPDKYRTRSNVFAGDEVVIVEPGWRLGGRVVKQPLVSKTEQ